MTEAEITLQISEYLNRIWVLQQWWASISIGVLIMAHLAAARLNPLLLVISLGLYTSYTLYMAQMAADNVQSVFALARDLQVMIDAGEVSSYNAHEQVDIINANPVLYYVTFIGTYVSVIAYLVYSYLRVRREEQGR
jgi:hypothetical protein